MLGGLPDDRKMTEIEAALGGLGVRLLISSRLKRTAALCVVAAWLLTSAATTSLPVRAADGPSLTIAPASMALGPGDSRHVVVLLANPGSAVLDNLVLSVSDDGVGFQAAELGRTGMGIGIMRYRAKAIGASLEVQTQAGQGTQITCKYHLVADDWTH